MAKGLELQIVAEGIEDLTAANMLIGFQCDLAQGYLWSKPVSNSQFIKYSKVFNEGIVDPS